jgi:hypothetical protein
MQHEYSSNPARFLSVRSDSLLASGSLVIKTTCSECFSHTYSLYKDCLVAFLDSERRTFLATSIRWKKFEPFVESPDKTNHPKFGFTLTGFDTKETFYAES